MELDPNLRLLQLIDVDPHLGAAAEQLLPHQPPHLDLQPAVLDRQAQDQVEETVIHAANGGRDPMAAALGHPFAESGHAAHRLRLAGL